VTRHSASAASEIDRIQYTLIQKARGEKNDVPSVLALRAAAGSGRGQMLRHRSGIEVHEGRASTLPDAGKDSGDQFLAAASLTQEQD
jgi:hypothetical protein